MVLQVACLYATTFEFFDRVSSMILVKKIRKIFICFVDILNRKGGFLEKKIKVVTKLEFFQRG